jgi:hypothetical protein
MGNIADQRQPVRHVDFSLQIASSAMMIVETDRSLNPTSRRIGNNDS